MLERAQKPFLTVETGEAYQPIRLSYRVYDMKALKTLLDDTLHCCIERTRGKGWDLLWADECEALHFESLASFQKNPKKPAKLAMLVIENDCLYVNLNSFKRACLLAPLLHKLIDPSIAKIYRADFVNTVFGMDQSLPGNFDKLFDEQKLEQALQDRLAEYNAVQKKCEDADTAETAFDILKTYTDAEAKKPLPYAERYEFSPEQLEGDDPDVLFLGFYIFLRGRELVAIRRWFGEPQYTMADAAEETIEKVFGGMDIDIIE